MTGRRVLVVAGLVLAWMLGVASAWLPVPLGGTYLALGVSALLWMALLASSVLLTRLAGGRAARILGPVVTLVLAVALLNWSVLAPRAWFEVHRPLYERMLLTQTVAGGDDPRPQVLPLHLRWLSVDGRTQGACLACDGPGQGPAVLYVPQWRGIPDNSGGYLYSPGRPPEGAELGGSLCLDPQDLGDGWWACGW